MRSRGSAALAALAPVVLLALARTIPELARADEPATCPACGDSFTYEILTTCNEGGGIDTDGCRYSVGSDGRLLVPELREVIACPSSRCAAAFFRGHLGRALPRQVVSEQPLARELGIVLDLAPRARTIVRAIATYRAYGLQPFGITDDPQAFEGKLWLRVAWAVREVAAGEDDVRRLPFVYAPRSAEWSSSDLSDLDREFQLRLSSGGAFSPLEAALAGVDEAREALSPLEPHDPDTPSRSLLFGRAVASIDEVERTLLDLRAGLREKSDLGGDMAPNELALALARAAHREGSIKVRDRWIDRATRGRDVPESLRETANRLRSLAAAEAAPMSRARVALEAAAEKATGERRRQLQVLAADAARRINEVDRARTLLESVIAGAPSGVAADRARALLFRLGETK